MATATSRVGLPHIAQDQWNLRCGSAFRRGLSTEFVPVSVERIEGSRSKCIDAEACVVSVHFSPADALFFLRRW